MIEGKKIDFSGDLTTVVLVDDHNMPDKICQESGIWSSNSSLFLCITFNRKLA
jgi:hypothetical protein